MSYQVVIDSHLNLLLILLYYLSFTTLHLVGMKNFVNKIMTFDLLIIHIHDFFNFYSMFLFLWRANLLFQVVHWFKRLCIRLVPLFLFLFFFFFFNYYYFFIWKTISKIHSNKTKIMGDLSFYFQTEVLFFWLLLLLFFFFFWLRT